MVAQMGPQSCIHMDTRWAILLLGLRYTLENLVSARHTHTCLLLQYFAIMYAKSYYTERWNINSLVLSLLNYSNMLPKRPSNVHMYPLLLILCFIV